MKRLLFIYNPHAGKELLKPKLADVIDIFVKAGYEVVAYPTQAYRDAYKKIKKYDSNEYDLVVCSGGDGTLDEVVTGMMKRDRNKRDPIGYIPTGTTNDFASSLHIPRGLLEAADNAVNGEVFSCDAGRFNDDIFVYIAAFGLFTDVSYQTKQSMKNVLGHLAYVLQHLRTCRSRRNSKYIGVKYHQIRSHRTEHQVTSQITDSITDSFCPFFHIRSR